MGALCSCFHVADVEEREESSTSNHRNCMCPKCLIQSLKYKFGAFFGGVHMHSVPSIEYVASSSSMVSPNMTQFDSNSNVTSYNKCGNSNSKRNLSSKSTNHSHSDLTMRKRISLQISSKLVIEDVSKVHHSEEDEDVCPTCLDEYTLENPKIVIQCRHSYHLSCIYEWMERSEKCPICGKLMVFDETDQSTTVLGD